MSCSLAPHGCAQRCDIITRMSTNSVPVADVEAITLSAQPALQVVFAAVEEARAEVERLIAENDSLRALAGREYTHQYIHLARYCVREHLSAHEDEMQGWRLNRAKYTNGAIFLHAGLQSIRLLHQRDAQSVPHAGTNKARRDFFTAQNPATDPARLLNEQRLLLLWQVWDASTARLVHPLSPGNFRRGPEIDLDLAVRRSEDDFSDLVFEGDLQQGLDWDAIADEEMTGTDD